MESTPLKLVVHSATLLGYAVILLCGVVLWSHMPGFRPDIFPDFIDVAAFPMFDPLTALALLVVALGLVLSRFRPIRVPGLVLALLGGALGALKIYDLFSGGVASGLLLPSLGVPAGAEAATPLQNGALCAAASILIYGISTLLLLVRRFGFAQAFAAVALLPCLASGVAYLLGTDLPLGRLMPLMLLATALAGIQLVASTGHRGAIRVFLSKTISGRFARQQILIATLAPILLAVFFARLLPAGNVPHAMAETVAAIVVIAWITIGATALVGRRLDLKRHRAEAELRNLARYDGLTGLLNRRSMDSRLPDQFAWARKSNRPITLLMCDLDHFKRLNDEFGHAAGDAVLRRTAERLSASVRDSDLVFRYGGEEMAVSLDCGPQEALRVAEKIRDAVKAPSRRAVDAGLPNTTISIGVASSQAGQTTLGQLLAAADECLYAAKDAGRDCVRQTILP